MTGNEPAPPPLQGIHHLKLPVSDLNTSLIRGSPQTVEASS